MTGQQIIDFFNDLVEETEDQDFLINLFNDALDLVEGWREWEFLKKVDITTLTRTTSQTYLTAQSLPTDFFAPRTVFVGEDEVFEIPLEQRLLYKDSSRFYYIDYSQATKQIYFTGTVGSTQTVTLVYDKTTTALTSGNLTSATLITWPERYQKLIAYLMGEMYQGGVNPDDIATRQAPVQGARALAIWNGMIRWDTRIKNSIGRGTAIGRARSGAPNQDQVDIDNV